MPLPPWAMRAGARDTIYFNPKECNCAIVTCGGLCPGLNDVVLGLVNKLSDYGVPEGHILGIRQGPRPALRRLGFQGFGRQASTLNPGTVGVRRQRRHARPRPDAPWAMPWTPHLPAAASRAALDEGQAPSCESTGRGPRVYVARLKAKTLGPKPVFLKHEGRCGCQVRAPGLLRQ